MEESSGYDGIGMYALPNPCTADTWSYTSTTERKTRFVLVASLNGKVCYYPIPLDPIGSNRSYDIKLKLYNTGSSDPETPVSKGSLESSINVIDWNTHIEDTNI